MRIIFITRLAAGIGSVAPVASNPACDLEANGHHHDRKNVGYDCFHTLVAGRLALVTIAFGFARHALSFQSPVFFGVLAEAG